MGIRNRVVVRYNPGDSQGLINGHERADLFKYLLELRRWCRQNMKNPWRTYEVFAGGGKQKYFIVFEFDSDKDEMLFRLKQGK